jgi:hypothetical protein
MSGVVTSFGLPLARPATFVSVKALASGRAGTVDPNRIAVLIGEAEGGAPYSPVVVTAAEIDSTWRAGDLVKSGKLHFNPSPNGDLRPNSAIMVNVRPGTSAVAFFYPTGAVAATFTVASYVTGVVTLTVATTTVTPARTRLTFTGGKVFELTVDAQPGLTLTGKLVSGANPVATDTASYTAPFFGLETNTFRERANLTNFSLATQTNGAYTLSVTDTDNGNGGYAFTDVGLGLVVRYKAVIGGTKTLTIANVGGVQTLTTAISLQASDNLSIQLSGQTTRAVAALIALNPNYEVIVGRDGSLDANTLDNVAAGDISAALSLKALKSDFALLLQNNPLALQYTKFIPGLGTGATIVAAAGSFYGGVSAATTANDWALGMESLKDFSFHSLVPLVDGTNVNFAAILAGIRAANAARADYLSSEFSHIFEPGNDTLLPVTDTKANVDAYVILAGGDIATISDPRISKIVTTGTIADPVTGLARRARLFEVAAMVAGLRMALGADIPVTYKNVRLSAAYPKMSFAQSNKMVGLGGFVLETPGRGSVVRVVFNRTTYIGESNAVYESEQGMSIVDSIARGFKESVLDSVIGNKLDAGAFADLSKKARDYLDGFVARGWLTSGFDAQGNAVAPYSFELLPTSYQGRLIRMKVRISPVLEPLVLEAGFTAQAVDFIVTSQV